MDSEIDGAKQTFVIECRELLQEMETGLLKLEESPDDSDAINALFRAAHTIKGSAGIVGVETVEKFTHAIENLMERIRQGDIFPSPDLIELLLKCRDHIASLVDLAAANDDLSGHPDIRGSGEALSSQLQAVLNAGKPVQTAQAADKTLQAAAEAAPEGGVETDNWHISLRFGPDVLRSGMDPSSFINYLSKLGEVAHLSTIITNMPRAAEMDPEACYLGFEIDFRSDFDKKAIGDVFEFVQDDCEIRIISPHSKIEDYIKLIEELPEEAMFLGELLVKGNALTQAELDHALKFQASTGGQTGIPRRNIGEILVTEGVVSQPVLAAAVEKQKKTAEHKAQESQTIRIETGKLDQLINLVGELVIAGANMDQQSLRIHDSGLMESASVLSRLIEEIRDRAMKVRMVQVGETFTRFQRVVRDISRDTGKDIELIISGGDTELDKNVVEKISDPLMHLVRNSADHGIETPEARTAKGKPVRGVVRLNAFHDAGSIVIEVGDDGGGLNREKILKKAIEKGLANVNQILSDREVFRFIFDAGFSTAEQVTKLSGRGVGMDVVRRNIEALRGTVDIESQENLGTTIRIRLPLTLAIIDGFMVGVCGSSYVIPLDMVVECIELSEEEQRLSYNRNYVNLRGEVLPYLRLRDIFDVQGEKLHYENVVVVRYAGQKAGLAVDLLYGEVQAVIKTLGRMYKDIEGISGATIMGDGTVALILDIPHLIKSVEKSMLEAKNI